jgi:2-polyprenyl-3-methyl-5-hydroxy-6-metoxy-1,4-benzoquinol methylase
MITINNCPVCNSTNHHPFLACKDYTVSKEIFQLVQCSSCNFVFTNPRPDNSNLGKYYASKDYISHSNTKKGIVSKLYHLVRNYTLKKKIDLVSGYVSRGTLLDYGCGTGMFLNTGKTNGWNTLGIEPDSGARQIASEMGLDVFEDKEKLAVSNPNLNCQVITLWHVLEHVTDLKETLAFFKRILDPKGALLIAVPNYKSYDAQRYQEFWAAYDVPRHLYHFSDSTIKLLLENNGFKLTEMHPMKFDSFYVSMLSEKYQFGIINYFKAFLSGLKSNLKAKGAGDYSSVIYVFKPA